MSPPYLSHALGVSCSFARALPLATDTYAFPMCTLIRTPCSRSGDTSIIAHRGAGRKGHVHPGCISVLWANRICGRNELRPYSISCWAHGAGGRPHLVGARFIAPVAPPQK